MDRAPLGVWETPLEPAPRLAERIGLRPDDLWIKRDDWIGLGGGGNKLRKLEFLCGAALAGGATTLVTTGAAQSNHCRQTAAAARRLGLGVVLVLRGAGPPAGRVSGNLALDGLFGADVRWVDVAIEDLDACAREIAASIDGAAIVPYGGTSAIGAQGYVACGHELARQAPDLRHAVCAVGSAGTWSGLAAGLGAERVLGVDVGAVPDAEARAAALVDELGGDPGALRFRGDVVGPGYEAVTERSRRAMDDAARLEGLVLDPVYTAKAFAGLAAAVEDGDIRPGERTVFVHTGGLPGFFGHPIAAEYGASTADG
jgi:D-cysteine desulfhydrase